MPSKETDQVSVAASPLGHSGGVVVRFELARKDKSVSLRLPAQLLEAVQDRAKRVGMPYQRFIRMALERPLHDPR
jgi:predicted DNA binding CopG/RHH family protein